MAFLEGETKHGWGVFRLAPWHFAGLFPTESEARVHAEKLGSDYQVAFGDNQSGTDNFVYESGEHKLD